MCAPETNSYIAFIPYSIFFRPINVVSVSHFGNFEHLFLEYLPNVPKQRIFFFLGGGITWEGGLRYIETVNLNMLTDQLRGGGVLPEIDV